MTYGELETVRKRLQPLTWMWWRVQYIRKVILCHLLPLAFLQTRRQNTVRIALHNWLAYN